VRGNPKARQEWAVDQVKRGARASRNLGLNASVSFSGALAWPYLYPWAATLAGPHRNGVRRAGDALEADPRRL
jgi:hypothetical protein